MHTSGGLRSEEASDAAWEAGRGAVVGAAKWGFFSAILGGVGWRISPIYKGLTIQFKVCQVGNIRTQLGRMWNVKWKANCVSMLKGMILGACLEADQRVREYEAKVRMHKRMVRDRAVWESYEKEFKEPSEKKP
ncbi:imidazoleglycerol-phosphate dehydratase [Drepanopeziza brunnea f. sp. 'multigermtubi' MB_m1]|uniref:Imidazoleglycerol-phosphate dehydratase n=1 Tax=Marssonina brunnea f. sp. multigermtubi (strain MB_m1) TaxID=1072389 RepID=K1X276_MARBU|nr:imidazoleglycerol-phosphate dehydratase [Drepanopeziza brunnea f. sp. 'multigermtubi' MB_m1]EKD14893.1 imidazoleglycerol-phosphate dehydratase [Drepanopeziza brunnea f. sp. 'multigermtubi' MB_m1]